MWSQPLLDRFFVLFPLFSFFIDFPAHCSQPLLHVTSISFLIPRPFSLPPHVSLKATLHFHEWTVSLRFFSSGRVRELSTVSNLPACSHYLNCSILEYDEMHLSIPSFGTEFWCWDALNLTFKLKLSLSLILLQFVEAHCNFCLIT